MKKNAQSAWSRYSIDRASYFAYPANTPNTQKLLATGKYGVVQLVCIDRNIRMAFMAGYRSGKRHAPTKS